MTGRDICGYLSAVDPLLMQPQYAIFGEGARIGRDADSCEIIISGDYVSRRHCAVEVENSGAVMLTDLNSSNGIYVNGVRVKRHVLAEQDAIACGRPDPPHFIYSTSPPSNERRYMLEERPAYGIGRDFSNALPLASDPTVSGFHARLRKRGDALVIEDLGSANGTFVNGLLVGSAALSPGDSVRIGSTELFFEPMASGVSARAREKRNQVRLEAQNICRDYRGKAILRDINLVVEPGEFVGVLGPSGAGKSTLLNALNGFMPASSGNVLLNRTSLYTSYDMFRNAIGYVPQDDIIHKELTVNRSLMYTARLRLPRDNTSAQLNQHVTSVIETLGLTHVRNNYVNQLSGGQRKRVSIGCELLTRPSLIFLDEPTSGLDPSTEEKLMNHFRRMAEQGQTVILTTHILYNLGLLDMVVLLARGRLVYFGPVADVCPFFSTADRQVSRPIEVFDLLEPETTDPNAREERAEYYEQKYRESSLYNKYVEKRQGHKTPSALELELVGCAREIPKSPKLSFVGMKRGLAGMFNVRQFFILMQRMFDLKLSFLSRLVVPMLTPLLLALLMSTITIGNQDAIQAERDTFVQENARSLDMLEQTRIVTGDEFVKMRFEGFPNLAIPLSVPLIIVMAAVFLGTLSACLEISGERSVYLRERAVNLSIPVYLASKLPVLFLLAAVQCFIFVFVSMLFIRVPHVNVLSIFLIAVGVAWVSCTIGLFISSLDPTPGQNSVVLAVIAVLPQLLFSGAMAPGFFGGMGMATKALASLFPARWGFELMLTAFYQQPEWARNLIEGTEDGGMGFRFGPSVYATNVLALTMLAMMFFLATCFSLKRNDRL